MSDKQKIEAVVLWITADGKNDWEESRDWLANTSDNELIEELLTDEWFDDTEWLNDPYSYTYIMDSVREHFDVKPD